MNSKTPASIIQITICLIAAWPILCWSTGTKEASDGEIRAIWVTRWDYRSKEDIRKIVENVASLHFNTIFFQVRGNGTVWYPSKFEPWAEELGGGDPGWNPLQEAIKQAEKHKIQLHAWINMFPGWRGIEHPEDQSQILNVHPDWFMVDQEQKPMPLNSHYVWINPALPAVTRHLSNIVEEIAEYPGLDGIHFDYFRYPGPGFSYDEKSIDLFHDRFGSAAPIDTEIWDQFRRDAITNWLREISNRIHTKKPDFIFSSAIIGDYDLGPRVFMQDSHQWLSEGIIDYLVTMTYTNDMNMLRRWLLRHRVHLKYDRIIPGLMSNSENKLLPKQIQMTRDLRFKGFSVFAYSSLFPNHRPDGVLSPAVRPLLSEKNVIEISPLASEEFYISDVKWYPEHPVSGDSIRVIGKIGGGENSDLRVVAVWFDTQDGTGAQRLNLKKSPSNSSYWYSTEYIPPQPTRDNLYFRLFAYRESNSAKAVSSDLHQVVVDVPNDRYRSAGGFGPLMSHVTRAALDSQGRIWVLVPGEGVRIIRPEGDKPDFSSLAPFDVKPDLSDQLIAIAPQNDSSMVVLANYEENPWLFESKLENPQFHVTHRLPKSGLDITVAGNGMLYILTNESWFVTTNTGRFVGESFFDELHTVNNIAVTNDGRNVFVACRTGGTVHHWFGYTTGERLNYTRMADLEAYHMSLGGISLAKDGLIFLAEAAAGLVRIVDSEFNLIDLLQGGQPNIRAPRLVLPSPDSKILYILETGGTTPVRMLKWISTSFPADD